MSADTTPDTKTGLETGLETGWRLDTPADDTVLRHGLLALAASWELIGSAADGRIHRDERSLAVDLGRPTGLFDSATMLQPLRDEAFAAALDQIERFYSEGRHGATLLWSPWPTPDLSDRGWTLQGHPPLLYRPAGIPVERRRREDLEVIEVTTSTELETWCRLAVEAFPLPDVDPPGGLFDPTILDDPRFRLTHARIAGHAAAVGCQIIVSGTNVLLLGATRSEYRGRGSYAALVADRLAQHPDLPAVTIVSDDSRPVLVERFGFLPISRFTLWERPRP